MSAPASADLAYIYSGMLATIRTQALAVDPAIAKHLRATAHFERQRPINQRNVERLALEMRRGWFVPGTPIYICVLPDGAMLIVNGNHTLEAVQASGVTVPLTFIYAKVPDISAAARIYACMDLQKVRTWGNALQAVAIGGDIPMVDSVVSAVGVIMAGFKSDSSDVEATSSRNARFAKLSDYVVAAQLLAAAWQGTPSRNQRMLRRAAILAVALETAKHQPAAATEFWGACAGDDGLKRGDPAKTLLRYLENNPVNGAAGRGVQCRAAALAWNAYFKGRSLDYTKPNSTTEFRLLGTDWHQGQPTATKKMAVKRSGAIEASSERPLFETGLVVTSSGETPVARFVG